MNDGPAFSHFGLFVRDIETIVRFYREALGFIETDRGKTGDRDIVFLTRDPKDHHQIVFVSGLVERPREEVLNQKSFRLPTFEALQKYATRAEALGATQFRSVDHGNAWAVYFRDPEGNRVELFVDSPWYVPQPCGEPFDITRPAAEIRAETEAWCRAKAGFRPAADFRAEVEARLTTALQ